MQNRTNTFAVALIVASGLSSGCTAPTSSVDAVDAVEVSAALQAVDTSAILSIVQTQLSGWLNSIPEGVEEDYGFDTREEFADAVLGEPYEMFSITNDGTIATMTRWQVPVSVDGRIRLLVEVQQSGAGYEVVGIGYAGLAADLDQVERNAGKGAKRKSIVRSFARVADFAVYDDEPSNLKANKSRKMIPLKSAREALSGKAKRVSGKKSDALDAAPLTLDETASLLRD